MNDPFAFRGVRNRGYFEGWYCKNVTVDGRAFAFIPGVSYQRDGTAHAFVQVIRGSDGETAYQRFPLEEFSADGHAFSVSVGPNRFDYTGIEIELPEVFGGIFGRLTYSGARPLQRSLTRPGIMGWYRYVPFMECYHEVGSVDHRIGGELRIGKETFDFSDGRGYLEKDWGTSMPSAWIWMQCNHFSGASVGDESPARDPAAIDATGISFMISIARVPWLGSSFPGFLGFIALPDAPVRTFGTYSGARIRSLSVEDKTIALVITLGRDTLKIQGHRSTGGTLAAPAGGAMDRRISESVDGRISLQSIGADRTTSLDVLGNAAGIEVVGDIAELS